MDTIRLIIFDYGRTLVEPGPPPKLVPNATEALRDLKAKGYLLKLASLLPDGETPGDRIKTLAGLGIDHVFEEIRFEAGRSKFGMLGKLSSAFAPKQIAVVDDRTAPERALHWGWLSGATTIWFRRGKFAHELPQPRQRPSYIVSGLEELAGIFPNRRR